MCEPQLVLGIIDSLIFAPLLSKKQALVFSFFLCNFKTPNELKHFLYVHELLSCPPLCSVTYSFTFLIGNLRGSLLISIYQWLVTRVANVFFQWESAIFITETFCILMKSNLPNFSFGNSGFSVFLMKVYTYPLVYKYFYKSICKIRSCNMWGYVVAFLPGQEGGGTPCFS